LIAALGLLGAVGLAAVGVHYRAEASASAPDVVRLPPRVRPGATPTNQQYPSGGLRRDLEIEAVPDAVLRDNQGKERLEYHFELLARLSGTAKFKFQVDFFDDRYHQVGTARAARVVEASEGASAVTEAFATPPDLPDGYYRAEVTAVATNGKGDASNVIGMYWHAVGGQLTELSIEDWYKQSRSNLAVN
jgi:hypothetical protein